MPSGVDFGAIRWDAWYSDTGPAVFTARALSDDDFRDRSPLHGDITKPVVRWLPTEATMAAEIAAAKDGGLAYWAFLEYEQSSPMMDGYKLYDAAPTRSDMPYCWITTFGIMGETGNFSTWVSRLTAEMQQAHYFKVMTNRPLLYLFCAQDALNDSWGGSLANAKAALDNLRASVIAAGLGDPYIVTMISGLSWVSDAGLKTGLGADAASAYTPPRRAATPSTYEQLDTATQTWWGTLASSTSTIVPSCTASFNPVPRQYRPVQWQPKQKIGFGNRYFTELPTNQELVTHLAAARDYVVDNPSICPAATALIYAWNEFDEGGWLAPTHGDPTGSKLTAISNTIAN